MERDTKSRVLLLLGTLAAALTLLSACQSVTDDEPGASGGEREGAEPGDIEVELGESAEVYGRRATVVGVERVAEFNEIDNEGYLVFDVEVTNTSTETLDHRRGDWSLELSDGRRVGTAPVEGQPQLRTGEFEPDESITGKVVFAVGDEPGPYAAVFMPYAQRNDTDDRERIVWVFSID